MLLGKCNETQFCGYLAFFWRSVLKYMLSVTFLYELHPFIFNATPFFFRLNAPCRHTVIYSANKSDTTRPLIRGRVSTWWTSSFGFWLTVMSQNNDDNISDAGNVFTTNSLLGYSRKSDLPTKWKMTCVENWAQKEINDDEKTILRNTSSNYKRKTYVQSPLFFLDADPYGLARRKRSSVTYHGLVADGTRCTNRPTFLMFV